mgnify:FL=1
MLRNGFGFSGPGALVGEARVKEVQGGRRCPSEKNTAEGGTADEKEERFRPTKKAGVELPHARFFLFSGADEEKWIDRRLHQ